MLSNLGGIALDAPGNLYIAEIDKHRIRNVTRDGIISTFAGNAYSATPAMKVGLNSIPGPTWRSTRKTR
jgi:hypothetical protein